MIALEQVMLQDRMLVGKEQQEVGLEYLLGN